MTTNWREIRFWSTKYPKKSPAAGYKEGKHHKIVSKPVKFSWNRARRARKKLERKYFRFLKTNKKALSTKQDDILPVITRGLPPFFICTFWLTRACLHREIFHKAGRHPSRDYTRPTSFLSVIFDWPEHAYIVKYSTKQDDILPVITRGLPPFFLYFLTDIVYIVKYSTKQDDILPVITRGLPPFFL